MPGIDQHRPQVGVEVRVDGDVIAETVEVAKALGWSRPVKVQWTRDNDMRGGRYRPAYVHAMKAGLDGNGNLIAWTNHIVGQSILSGTPFEGMMVKNGIDFTSVEGAANIPYAIPNLRVELTTTDAGVPVLWWRSVGSTHTAYAVEAFLDELAEAASDAVLGTSIASHVLDPPSLRRTAAVMGKRGDVLEADDHQTGGTESAHGGLAPRAGTLD